MLRIIYISDILPESLIISASLTRTRFKIKRSSIISWKTPRFQIQVRSISKMEDPQAPNLPIPSSSNLIADQSTSFLLRI